MRTNKRSYFVTANQWGSCILSAVAVSPCQWEVAAAGPAELSWVAAVNELSLYTLQYSGCTVQCTVITKQRASHLGPLGVCSLASKDEMIPPERDQAWPQWLQTTTLIKVRVISARENIYCCGDMLELYFQRYFSLLIFCLNILVRKACEKWVYRV